MPLVIDSLPVPDASGLLGMCRCPGSLAITPHPGPERLKRDVEALCDWGASAVVTLNQGAELQMLGLDALGTVMQEAGLTWMHCPITDFSVPGRDFEREWQHAGPACHAYLSQGHRVVLHCLAGLGRTGTVAARLLVERGLMPEDAVRRVREARPGTIQTDEQLLYVLRRAWNAGRT
jgi:protein-tyrosine phosphatase